MMFAANKRCDQIDRFSPRGIHPYLHMHEPCSQCQTIYVCKTHLTHEITVDEHHEHNRRGQDVDLQ